jgi:radical SAM superfamily enzyme YgiQ (UPF0313 family)
VRWVCETRLDSVTPDLLAAMRAAGCMRIHYGLESGDPDLFAAVGKPGSSLQQVDQVVAETLRAGIEAHLFVLVGMRGETWRTVRNTLRTLRRWRPSTVQVAVLTPYPGTPLFEEAAANGLILTRDWSRYDGFQVVMRTPGMSARDLARAKRYLLVNYHEGGPLLRGAAQLRKLATYTLDGTVWPRLRRRLSHRRAVAPGG